MNTETASGKTLAFLLPILNDFLIHKDPTNSIFLFPTKALAYDQYQQYIKLTESVFFDNVQSDNQKPIISVYDGDTIKLQFKHPWTVLP